MTAILSRNTVRAVTRRIDQVALKGWHLEVELDQSKAVAVVYAVNSMDDPRETEFEVRGGHAWLTDWCCKHGVAVLPSVDLCAAESAHYEGRE